MVKTLRITGFMMLLAGIAVFLVVGEACADEQMDELLKSPTIMDKFEKLQGIGAGAEDAKSPLVQEAQSFARYLNPPPAPKPPKRPSKPRSTPSVKPKPAAASVKFKLIGTSYYASKPDLSLALIDEPGKGFRWVRRSDKIGRMVIEQIKDGVVIVNDGSKTIELKAKRPPKKSLLRGKKSEADKLEKQMSDREIELFNQMVDELQVDAEGDSINDEQAAARMEKFVSQLKGVRISGEEAESLDKLGQELKGVDRAAQQAQKQREGKILRTRHRRKVQR